LPRATDQLAWTIPGVNQVDDRSEIGATLSAYSQLLDDGRFEPWSELFTEDARLSFPGRSAEGRDEIRALMEKVQPDGARGKHMTANTTIEVRGDTATGTTDYLFVRAGAEGIAIVSAGRYDDTLVREGGRWRFRERLISFLDEGGSTGG
jgi:uncharacterized protein (TIGR02246 family)